MVAPLDKTGIGHDLVELIAKGADPFCRGRSREKRLLRIIAGIRFLEERLQRRSKRDHDVALGLATDQRQLAALEVDVLPSQPRDVSDPLAGVEPEQNQPDPFAVRDTQKSLDLRQLERTPARAFLCRFGRSNADRNVRGDQTLGLRVLERHAHDLHGVVGRRGAQAQRQRVAKFHNIAHGDRADVDFGACAERFNERVDRASVSAAGARCCLALLVFGPRLEKLPRLGPRQLLAVIVDRVDLRENFPSLNIGERIAARRGLKFLRKLIRLATVGLLGGALELTVTGDTNRAIPEFGVRMSMNGGHKA